MMSGENVAQKPRGKTKDLGWSKNFIKPIPDGWDVAIDESLLWLQVRTRKGSESEKKLREFIKPILSGGGE